MESLNSVELRELRGGGFENASYQQDEEGAEPGPGTDPGPGLFSGPDPGPVSDPGPGLGCDPGPGLFSGPASGPGPGPDPGLFSGPGPDPGLFSGPDPGLFSGPGWPVDRGLLAAVVLLGGGVVLVLVAYSVPREAGLDRGAVPARRMEAVEAFYARRGAQLDRCIIAGLGLLTAGGALLAGLLTAALCRGGGRGGRGGRGFRTKATYGSTHLRMKHLGEEEGGGADTHTQ